MCEHSIEIHSFVLRYKFRQEPPPPHRPHPENKKAEKRSNFRPPLSFFTYAKVLLWKWFIQSFLVFQPTIKTNLHLNFNSFMFEKSLQFYQYFFLVCCSRILMFLLRFGSCIKWAKKADDFRDISNIVIRGYIGENKHLLETKALVTHCSNIEIEMFIGFFNEHLYFAKLLRCSCICSYWQSDQKCLWKFGNFQNLSGSWGHYRY